jgi:DNA-binding transcriptional MerR regulator
MKGGQANGRARLRAIPGGRGQSVPPPPAAPGEAARYRMKELCDLTGLPRQAIHFYIQEGLVPAGTKTGRNTAFYGDEHVERLKLIKKLQHEKFLPLRAIKALLDGSDGDFTADQQHFLGGVKRELDTALRPQNEGRLVDLESLGDRTGVARDEIEQMIELGFLGATKGPDGRAMVTEDDAWIVENYGRMRAAGFSRELGFGPEDLAIYAEAIEKLLVKEREMLAKRLAGIPPARAARMIERALPIVHDSLVRLHIARVRAFFSSF